MIYEVDLTRGAPAWVAAQTAENSDKPAGRGSKSRWLDYTVGMFEVDLVSAIEVYCGPESDGEELHRQLFL